MGKLVAVDGKIGQGRSDQSARSEVRGRFAGRRIGLGFGVWLLSAVVCGCGSFAPEPPPGLTEIGDPQKVPTVTVELILAGDDVDDRVLWKQGARVEAANAKVIFTIAQMTDADPRSKMAELILKDVERGIKALVVEPVDDPSFDKAVNEARSKGVVVVVLDRKVPGPDPAKVYPAVVFAPFETPARSMVEDVLKRAETDGVPADGTALLLVNPKFGPDVETRVAALKKVMGDAGIKTIERLDFTATKLEDAAKALTAKLETDPKITIVVCHEEFGMSGAALTKEQLRKANRKIEVCGTAAADRAVTPILANNCSGILDRNVTNLGRQATKIAANMAKGEPVAQETLIPLNYHQLTMSDRIADDRTASANAAAAAANAETEKEGPVPPKNEK